MERVLFQQISHINEDIGLFGKLMRQKVTLEEFITWADDYLTKQWGSHMAARACSVARSGYDGKVIERGIKKCPSSQKLVSQDEEVPGAFSPVNNAYQASQILSWFARQCGTIQGQMEKMMEIPHLVDELIYKYAS